jgi:hypothetical protein
LPEFALAGSFLEGLAAQDFAKLGVPDPFEAVTVRFAIDAARDDLEALIVQAHKRSAGEGR